jgi:hypothetical protein
MAKIIHVNSIVIQSNKKWGDRKPPLTVREGRNKVIARGQEIRIESDPPVIIKYSPEAPLSCGARVWIESDAEVSVRSLGDVEYTPANKDKTGADIPT